VTPETERRVAALLEVLVSHPQGITAVQDMLCREVRNAEWKAYAMGYDNASEGKDRLDERVQPGW
jgi:hypothetical protein